MTPTLQDQFRRQLPAREPADPEYVSELVDRILFEARRVGASDVHLVPTEDGLEMSWRIDGVLQPVDVFPVQIRGNVVSRLKVLAELLTYRTDVPQEGRIRTTDDDVEMRVSTFPTLYGEKAVIRLFVGSGRYRYLDDLGLPDDIASTLKNLLLETGGVILISGPAGSGKTTTAYACLRELADVSPSPPAPLPEGEGRGEQSRALVRKSIVTLEDPIEAVVRGAAQSQVKPAAGFDYETGLRSLMRQDPEVILVGEIRDPATAETVFGASLTGHLVLTTFHAGSAAEAVGRLLEMGIEPYQLRSGILAVVNQRLLRRLCECARPNESPEARLGLPSPPAPLPEGEGSGVRVREPVGCDRCRGTGYRDRMVIAEMLLPHRKETARGILSRSDSREIERVAVQAGMVTRWQQACAAVDRGETSPAEVRRVLGFR